MLEQTLNIKIHKFYHY